MAQPDLCRGGDEHDERKRPLLASQLVPRPSGQIVPKLCAIGGISFDETGTKLGAHPVPKNRPPALRPLVLNFHS